MAERDYAYEALAEVCGLDMDADRGRLNAALKEIREREPDLAPKSESYLLGDMIHTRAKLYRSVMGEAMLTPTALAKHWDALPGEDANRRKLHVVNAPPASREDGMCPMCGGDKIVTIVVTETFYETTAPCPSCNANADAGFWRHDGTHFTPMHPDKVRELLA